MQTETISGLTAVFMKVEEGYIGYIEEIPGVNTQGADLDETRENLREALILVLEANREMANKEVSGSKLIREKISVGI